MINEYQLNHILTTNNNFKKSKIINNKTLFGSPLKKFINSLYDIYDIPKESFIISLFYINKYYKINKNNDECMKYLFNNINIFIFTCIIIGLKILLDEPFNIKNICISLNINYDKYILFEKKILSGLNWNISYNNNDYLRFKMYLAHYMDLFQRKN